MLWGVFSLQHGLLGNEGGGVVVPPLGWRKEECFCRKLAFLLSRGEFDLRKIIESLWDGEIKCGCLGAYSI